MHTCEAALGRPRHFAAAYLQEVIMPLRETKAQDDAVARWENEGGAAQGDQNRPQKTIDSTRIKAQGSIN